MQSYNGLSDCNLLSSCLFEMAAVRGVRKPLT